MSSAIEPSVTMLPFADLADSVSQRVADPGEAGVDRYVGLEHLDSDSLRIRRWGAPEDVSASKLRFRPGDVIFGKRRAYQRKVGVPTFDGICSAHAMVLRAKPERVIPEFLPYLVQSDKFMDRALAISVGSLSPTINWRTLRNERFPVPDHATQHRAAALLSAVDATRWSHEDAVVSLEVARRAFLEDLISSPGFGHSLVELDTLVDQSRPICYGILKPGPHVPDGVPVVAVKDYPQGEVAVNELQRTTPELDREFARSRLRPADLLLSIRGTVGRVATVPADLPEANISRDTARIALKPDVNIGYVRALLESSFVQRQIRVRTVGLAVQGINVRDIRRLRIPVPSARDQERLLKGLRAFDQLKESITHELSAVACLRRGLFADLLPELTHDVH
jgi:hypothetical protein